MTFTAGRVAGILAILGLGVAAAPRATSMQEAGDADPADSTVVGNTGDARWSIPIALPPGPGGFTPTLSVDYSSHRGDGPFGVGWDIPISQIVCSARFGVSDYVNPGNGTPCPRFELDGELLNHAGSGRYHTFVESFQRIHYVPATDHWEVTGMDGIIRRYGTSSDSRVAAPSGNAARWLLAEVENPYGQKIRYTYAWLRPADWPSNGPGYFYLERITYGPSSTNPEREVVLQYEERDDWVHDYSGGVERLIAFRATGITSYSHGQQHSRYLLGYDLADLAEAPSAAWYTTQRSRLAWVQRFGSDCGATDPLDPETGCQGLPAQQFRYTDPKDGGGPAWVDEIATSGGASGWDPPHFNLRAGFYTPPAHSATRYGDINGDGLIDYATAATFNSGQRPSPAVRLNTGTGWGAGTGSQGPQEAAFEASLSGLRFAASRLTVTIAPVEVTQWGTYPVCAVVRSEVDRQVAFARSNSESPGWLHVPQIAFDLDPHDWEERYADPTDYSREVDLLGNFHLADLNGDGFADLVMSIEVSGMHRSYDCQGNALPEQERILEPFAVQVAFRNNGSGWVRDDDLIAGLPAFGMLIVEDPYRIWGKTDETCWGFVGDKVPEGSGAFDYWTLPCLNHVSFSPRFVDLSGDGKNEIIVSAPAATQDILWISTRNSLAWWVYAGEGESFPWEVPRSHAWSLGTSGWARESDFDIPFHHAGSAILESSFWADSTRATDLGVRFADLNQDGYTDIVWHHPFEVLHDYEADGDPKVRMGALLNRGKGNGSSFSSWCATVPDVSPWGHVDQCSDPGRYVLPEGAEFAQEGTGWTADVSGPSTTFLVDLNGDGLLDLTRGHDERRGIAEKAWIYSPGAVGATAWVESQDVEYRPPVPVGNVPGEHSWKSPQSAPMDVNGDGVVDWVRHNFEDPSNSFVSQHRLPDRLREIRTGTGGLVRIDYDTGSRQRDAGLESDAWEHASWQGEVLAPGEAVIWNSTALVARVEVEGANRASALTMYRYAHPRFCIDHRSHLGYRIVEKTGPDGSRVTTAFYQNHGRAGKVSQRQVSDETGPLRSEYRNWDLIDPGGVVGAWAGSAVLGSEPSRLGRIVRQMSQNEYGSDFWEETGSQITHRFEYAAYDSSYGHNFVSSVTTTRSSGSVIERREPWGTAEDLVRGLVETHRTEDGVIEGAWLRKVEYQYTVTGEVLLEKQHQERRDGSQEPDPAETRFAYDEFGNLVERIDAEGRVTQFCYDASPGTQHTWCEVPQGQTSASTLVGRLDPPVGEEAPRAVHITPHPVFAVPQTLVSEYTDVPGSHAEFDPFGREVGSWILPEGESMVQVSSTDYEDFADPPYSYSYAYSEAGQSDDDAIRTARVTDGFGGVWKQVRDVPPAEEGGAKRYAGAAIYRDPNQNLTRETYDFACDSDKLCAGLTGLGEVALATTTDALGRPLFVDTPDGTSLFHYTSAEEGVVGPTGVVGDAAVDVVLEQNPNGYLTRRSFDGNRLLAVEECTNAEDAQTALADKPCQGSAIRTLYGYHPSGQLEVIHDPLAVAGPAWGSPRHQLRYTFDTAGRVIRIDDPDGGVSLSFYDAVGNVTRTERLDAQGNPTQVRTHGYDALDRLTGITTPAGEPNHTISYRSGELQPGWERSGSYHDKEIVYDAYGRVIQEIQRGAQRAWPQKNSHAHDLLGRRTGFSYERVGGASYSYEGAYLKRIHGCSGKNCPKDAEGKNLLLVDDVVYDALGRRKEMHLPGGVRGFAYMDEQTNEERRHLLGDTFEHVEGGEPVVEIEYTARDALANLLGWSVGVDLDEGLDSTQSYTYDPRNRISTWTRNGATEHFGYDALGNLVNHGSAAPGLANQAFGHATKPHAVTQRLGAPETTFAYTDSGNVSSATGAGVAGRYYDYDSADQLVCVSSSTARDCDVLEVFYDIHGVRVREVAPTTTRLFQGHEFVQTLSAGETEWRVEISAFGERVAYKVSSSDGPAGAQAEVPPALEIPWQLVALPPLTALGWLGWLALQGGVVSGVARRPATAAVSGLLITSLALPFPVRAGGGNPYLVPVFRWVLSDLVGSGIIVLDENGGLVRHTRFKPFGEVDLESGYDTRRRFYAGHPAQQETGLVYMKARWMSPTTGTFLSVDPMARATAPRFYSESDARLDELMELASGVRQRGQNAHDVDASPVGNTERFESEDPASFDPYRPSSHVGSSRPNSKIKLYKWDPPTDPKPKRPGSRGSDSEDDDWGPFSGPDGELAGLGMDPAMRRGERPAPPFGLPRWTSMDGPELARLIASNPYPYAYGLNNPISFRDPDGELWLQVTAWVLLVTFTTMAVTSPSQPNPAFKKPPGAPPKVPGSGAANSPTLPPPSRPVPEFVPNIQ